MTSGGEDSDASMEEELGGVSGGGQGGKRPAQVDLDRYRVAKGNGKEEEASTAGGVKASRRSSGMRSSRGTGARASTGSEVETQVVETQVVKKVAGRKSVASVSKSSPKDERGLPEGLSKEDMERRRANIAAMMSGTNLNTERNSLMPSLLIVDKDTTTLKKAVQESVSERGRGIGWIDEGAVGAEAVCAVWRQGWDHVQDA